MKTSTKRAALYASVSTDEQTTDNQLLRLRKIAKRHGWKVAAEFVDQGISGAKRGDKRPQYNALLKGVTRKDFDVVAAISVDRLGRSLQDLLAMLQELESKKIDLYLDREAVDTSTPMGKAMFQIAGVFAQLERSIIQERVKAGLARARAQGKRLGRPPTGARVEQRIRDLRKHGKGMLAIGRELKVGTSVVQRVLAGA